VLAAEHFLDLAAFDETRELLDPLGQLGRDVFALLCPIQQYAQIVGLRLERRHQLDFFLDAAAALENFLRLDLVVPEVGRRGAGLYLGKFVMWAGRLKDSSADRRRV
jgi:hypothetical protein